MKLQRFPNLKLLFAPAAIALAVFNSGPAYSEGSRSLYPSGTIGNRANLEWRNSNYANLLKRRTLLKVYANAGEWILLGSSAIGVNNGDALVYNPGLVSGVVGQETIPGTASFKCSTQRAATGNVAQGRIYTTATPNITARQRELAGPDTITNPATATRGNVVTNGYVPCFYQAPSTGIYSIVFYGPTGDNSNLETPPTGSIDPVQEDLTQNTSVAAWDVTVRNSLTSTTDNNGRLFADYLALFTGSNNRPLYSKLTTVTRDGYQYLTSLNGVDPNGFITYANDVGFLDSDGQTPLYRDLVDGTNDQLTAPQGGVTLALPTHLIFFTDNTQYTPDSAAIAANGIPLIPTAPVISNVSFTGAAGGNTSYPSAGGTFTYTSNISSIYEIIISRNGTDFDPTNPSNRVLRGVRGAGTQTVVWNGLDNSGVAFPVGNNYQVRTTLHAGEYHFPLLDAENSPNGGPSYTLINPPGACPFTGCRNAFYDDRGYRTLNGTNVGTVNTVLSGTHPGAATSGPGGFDSGSTQRAFSNGFGDKRGLDLWTYYPSATVTTPLNIINQVQRDLAIAKSHTGNFRVGTNGVYTLTVTSVGSNNVSGNIRIVDTLPTGMGFVSASGTGWTCAASGQTVTCNNLNGLASGTTSTVALTVSVGAATAANVTNTATVSNTNDTNATNNTATDPTIVTSPSRLRLVKRITRINTTAFTGFVDDPVSTDDNAENWPTPVSTSLQGAINGGLVKTGDDVEYTIYFLSDGGTDAQNVTLCDLVPINQTLVPNAFSTVTAASGGSAGGNRGMAASINNTQLSYTNAGDGDGGQFYPSGNLVPVTAGGTSPQPCPATNVSTNGNGAIVVNLGTILKATAPGSPAGSYGFVRFKAKVN
ncbi:MAG TPA: hypothetical protein V6C63_05685 [Allocoleopsis sp.]